MNFRNTAMMSDTLGLPQRQEALLAGELRAHDKQRGGVDVEGPDTVRCELRILTVEQVYKEGGEQKHDQPQENG